MRECGDVLMLECENVLMGFSTLINVAINSISVIRQPVDDVQALNAVVVGGVEVGGEEVFGVDNNEIAEKV